jgi:hypothetical protein
LLLLRSRGDFCDWLRLCYYWLNYWLYRGYCAFGSGGYGRGDRNRRQARNRRLLF